MEKKFCVYRHVRTINGKSEVFYIGIGSIARSKTKFRKSVLWHKAVDECNGEFRVDVLFSNVSLKFAKDKERELIALYGRTFNNTGTLVNIHDGGDIYNIGSKLTESHKRKIGNGNRGKIRTDEAKEKCRIANLGKCLGRDNPNFVSLIHQINKDTGEIIDTFESLTLAEKATGVQFKNIHKVVKGQRHTAGGFKWRREGVSAN